MISKQGTHRYGKSMFDVMSVRSKSHMLADNDKYVVQAEKIYKLYQEQPKRAECKICSEPLPRKKYFHNCGTDFFLCESCGHLNGEYDDGWAFSNALYELEHSEYGDVYRVGSTVEYTKRMDAIHVPKVQFLLNAIDSDTNPGGASPDSLIYRYRRGCRLFCWRA